MLLGKNSLSLARNRQQCPSMFLKHSFSHTLSSSASAFCSPPQCVLPVAPKLWISESCFEETSSTEGGKNRLELVTCRLNVQETM